MARAEALEPTPFVSEEDSPFLVATLPHALTTHTVSPYALALTSIFSSTPFVGWADRPFYRHPTLISRFGHMEVQQVAGYRLDQRDGDVVLAMLQMAINTAAIESRKEIRIRFGRGAILKTMGWGQGKNEVKRLEESLERLWLGKFRLAIPGLVDTRKLSTGFVLKYAEVSKDGAAPSKVSVRKERVYYEVLLDLELPKLLQYNQWALLDMGTRAKLQKIPLAKTIHAYFTCYPVNRWLYLDSLLELADRHELVDANNNVVRPAMRAKPWRELVDKAIKLLGTVGWKLTVDSKGRLQCKSKPGQKAIPAPKAEQGPSEVAPLTGGPLTWRAQWLESKTLSELRQLAAALGRRVQTTEPLSRGEETELLRTAFMQLDVSLDDMVAALHGDDDETLSDI